MEKKKKFKKTVETILIIIIICGTLTATLFLGYWLGSIRNNKTANAEEEITYCYYNVEIYKIPFPVLGVDNANYNSTMSGKNEFGSLFKLFNIKIYEKDGDNKYLIKNQGVKITAAGDTGYVYMPIRSKSTSITNNTTDWHVPSTPFTTFIKNDKIFGIMQKGHYENGECLIYDKTIELKFSTHHEIQEFIVEIEDVFMNKSISSEDIGLTDLNYYNITGLTQYPTTGTTYNTEYPIAITKIDKDYGYENGYEEGQQTGYNQGYEEGLADGKEYEYNFTYDNGYRDGKEVGLEEGYNNGFNEGYEKGNMNINADVNEIVPSTIGAIADFIMTLLNIEIAGISLWMILAAIGGLLIIGIIIKLAL